MKSNLHVKVYFHMKEDFLNKLTTDNNQHFLNSFEELTILPGYKLLAIGKKRAENLNCSEVSKQFQKLLKNDAAIAFYRCSGPNEDLPSKLPSPICYGYCHRCPDDVSFHLLETESSQRNFFRHLRSDHVPRKCVSCQTCGKQFSRNINLEKHYCSKAKVSKADFQTYVLKKADSKIVDSLNQLTPLQFFETCFEEKFCVPNRFPAISPTLGHRGGTNFETFGTTKSRSFLKGVLTEKVHSGGENRILIHKNIRIVNELGDELFRLGEDVLRPNSKVFKVSELNDELWEISLCKPPQIDIHLRGRRRELDSLAQELGLSEYKRHVQDGKPVPHAYPNAQTAMQNKFVKPWLMTEHEVQKCVGMSAREFWLLVEALAISGLTTRHTSLSAPATVVLFRLKLRHNVSNDLLSVLFQVKKQSVSNIFWNCAMLYYSTLVEEFGFWSKPNLTESEKDHAFQAMIQRQSIQMKEITSKFADPLGKDRTPYLVIIDSTKIPFQKSSDMEFQKSTYSAKNACHCGTITNITTAEGHVVAFSMTSASISPAHGDTIIMGKIISDEIKAQEAGCQLDLGMTNILKGTDKHFALVIVDKGYDFVPHNLDLSNLVTLKDYCQESGALFIAPLGPDPEEIMQFNSVTKKIEPVSTKGLDGLESKILNHKCLVGTVRKGVEMAHAAIKQDKIWTTPLQHHFLEPIGYPMAKRLGLNPDFAQISKVQIMYGCTIGTYNQSHAKFHVQFANEEEQKELANLIDKRLNLVNPFESRVNFPFKIDGFPRKNDKNWTTFPLSDLDAMRDHFPIKIPVLDEKDKSALMDLAMGNYRWKRAGFYTTLARRAELEDCLSDFKSHEEFIAACRKRPQSLEIKARLMEECPADWDIEEFGEFPKDGLLILYTRFPSANRSSKAKQYRKEVMIAFANQPNTKLDLKSGLKSLFGWRCSNKARVPDVCSRMMGLGAHPLAFLLLLLCPWWESPIVCPMPLTDTRKPDHLQPRHPFNKVFPDGHGDAEDSDEDPMVGGTENYNDQESVIEGLDTTQADDLDLDNGPPDSSHLVLDDEPSIADISEEEQPDEAMDVDEEPLDSFNYQAQIHAVGNLRLVQIKNSSSTSCWLASGVVSLLWAIRQSGLAAETTRWSDLPQPRDGFNATMAKWIQVATSVTVEDKPLLKLFVEELKRDQSYLAEYKAAEDFFFALLPDDVSPGCPLAEAAQPEIVEVTTKSGCGCKSFTHCSQPTVVGVYSMEFPMSTLQEAIQDSFSHQRQGKCSSCGQAYTEKLKKVFNNPTPILAVSINRILWSNGQSQKVEAPVDIGGILAIPTMGEPAKYQLVSAIEHKGSLDSGHYTAHVLDDSSFFEVDGGNPIKMSAGVSKCQVFLYKKL